MKTQYASLIKNENVDLFMVTSATLKKVLDFWSQEARNIVAAAAKSAQKIPVPDQVWGF